MSHGEEEYNWIDGVESLEKYRPGGYHPVMIGDMLHARYHIVDKLGFGGYSTIWLARDTHQEQYVAVKVGIADALPRETKILRALSSVSAHPGRKSIPSPLDEFEVHGPNGTHPCYTMAPARCNLREVSFSRLFPIEVARALSGGLVLAIAYTHSQGYVHEDVHLRNVLVKLPSGFDQLSIEQLYEEYGQPETVTITERDGKPLPPNVLEKAVIPLYLGKNAEEILPIRHMPGRPPEARFEPEAPLSYSADIWSLATTIWDILGMKAIFSSDFATVDEMVAQQIDVLGAMPLSWFTCWEKRGQFFDDDGRPVEGRHVWPSIDKAFEEGVQKYRRKSGRVDEFDREEMAAILDLMRRMLAFRPEERPTAEEVLKSEWMVKWVLPEYNKAINSRSAVIK
ncbi:hypothetical protein CDV55_105607 [Aspergillus turcosus]|nr:hypothetical protein CDV55_105607 [Aspergillus turcosus]